jgi:hypothetical protein
VTPSKHAFSIDIVLRHPSCTPESISEALSIKPQGSYPIGQEIGKLRAKRSFFFARLQEGEYASEFNRYLSKVVSFLEKKSAFWTEFIGGGGEVEVILNCPTWSHCKNGDKTFELSLAPAFLGNLSDRGIGLKIQTWQTKSKDKNLQFSIKGKRLG